MEQDYERSLNVFNKKYNYEKFINAVYKLAWSL